MLGQQASARWWRCQGVVALCGWLVNLTECVERGETGKQWTKHWVEGLGGTNFRLQKTNALLPLKSVLVIQPHSFRDIWRGSAHEAWWWCTKIVWGWYI